MKLWNNFYDYTIPELPGIDTALLDTSLRDVAIDFCEQTWCIVTALDSISTVAGTYEYQLDSTESGMEVFAIKMAWIDSAPVAAESMDDLWGANTDWRTYQGKPLYYAQQDFQNILLYPVPDAVYTLDTVGALRPTINSLGVPDRMFADYRKVIVAGAKANLMAQPTKPWSNPQLADFYAKQYQGGITSATVLVNRARARATLQVRYRTSLA
jgi:hypothetical protein